MVALSFVIKKQGIKLHDLTKRASGDVLRYHTWPTIKKQSVAEHTWNVLRIYNELFGPPEKSVFQHILYHDAAELLTGDIPFEMKRKQPIFKEAVNEAEDWAVKILGLSGILKGTSILETLKIKFCDLQEMAEFSIIEIKMGNELARPILDNILSAQRALLSRRELVDSNKDIAAIMRGALFTNKEDQISYNLGFNFGLPHSR